MTKAKKISLVLFFSFILLTGAVVFKSYKEIKIYFLLKNLNNRQADIDDRYKAAIKLKELKTHKAYNSFLIILQDESEEILLRSNVMEGLGIIGDRKAVPVISSIWLNEKQDQNFRAVAALALGNLGGEDAIRSLSKAYHSNNDSIRFKSLQGLEMTGDTKALETVIEGLNDKDKYVRTNAIHALGILGNESHVPIIIDILNKTDDDFIKIGCIEALGNLGGNEAIDILNKYKNDPNDLLKINSERMLENFKNNK